MSVVCKYSLKMRFFIFTAITSLALSSCASGPSYSRATIPEETLDQIKTVLLAFWGVSGQLDNDPKEGIPKTSIERYRSSIEPFGDIIPIKLNLNGSLYILFLSKHLRTFVSPPPPSTYKHLTKSIPRLYVTDIESFYKRKRVLPIYYDNILILGFDLDRREAAHIGWHIE